MKITTITDAYYPQVNGVATTLFNVKKELTSLGHAVEIITPYGFSRVPCPTYKEMVLTLPTRKVFQYLEEHFKNSDAIHISTEGPLGWYAWKVANRLNLPFTSSFHTKLPEYAAKKIGLPVWFGYSVVKRLHRDSIRVLATTPSLKAELIKHGFRNVKLWTRGVDTNIFSPTKGDSINFPRPLHLYVGRVSIEKNLDAFLSLDLPGSKVVVGDGPSLLDLSRKYKDTHFIGTKFGEELASLYTAADVFVFPSLTDTFGLVQLEAMACGTPVAAFPVPGPIDVITPESGSTNQNLEKAIKRAYNLKGKDCISRAKEFTWHRCAKKFLKHLEQIER